MKTIRPNDLGGLVMAVSACLALAACGQSGRNPEMPAEPTAGAATEITTTESKTPRLDAANKAKQAELEAAERVERAREERLARIEGIRQKDPALNWVNVGISTGKFSENINTTVHRTYAECVETSVMEDNRCFPIPKLPDSYWKAGE